MPTHNFFGGKEYDPANISGKTLAEIGRIVLSENLLPKQRVKARLNVIDYESLKWLDDRISEVCDKGQI